MNPETLTEYSHGLAEVAPVINARLDDETAELELTPLQIILLGTAISSVVSELKMYSVFDTMSGESARPRSTARGFDARMRELFPQVEDDPAYASDLAEDMTLLRRELPSSKAREILEEQQQASLAAQRARKKRWQFWRR